MLQTQSKHNNLDFLAIPIIVTVAIIVAPVAPDPLCFWLSLFAILSGPGWGIPRILFSRRDLSLPATIFIVIIMSIFIDTVIFAGLNSLEIILSRFVVSLTVLSTTYISTIAALVFENNKKPLSQNSNNDQASWTTFGLGIVFALLIVIALLSIINSRV